MRQEVVGNTIYTSLADGADFIDLLRTCLDRFLTSLEDVLPHINLFFGHYVLDAPLDGRVNVSGLPTVAMEALLPVTAAAGDCRFSDSTITRDQVPLEGETSGADAVSASWSTCDDMVVLTLHCDAAKRDAVSVSTIEQSTVGPVIDTRSAVQSLHALLVDTVRFARHIRPSLETPLVTPSERGQYW